MGPEKPTVHVECPSDSIADELFEVIEEEYPDAEVWVEYT